MKLFRYEPNESSRLSTVRNGQIWMSNHYTFNDPFDVSSQIRPFREPSWSKNHNLFKAIKALYSEVNENELHWILSGDVLSAIKKWCLTDTPATHNGQNILNMVRERVGKFGMSCFCSSLENPLMWSHYANSHKGFCIEYEVTPMESENGHAFMSVNYTSKISKLNAIDLLLNTNYFCENFLASKSPEWAYEGEYRFIDCRAGDRLDRGGYPILLPSCIKPVAYYIGMKAEDGFQDKVKLAFSEFSAEIPGFKVRPKAHTRDFYYDDL